MRDHRWPIPAGLRAWLRRHDVLAWLIILALLSLAVWGFLQLADEVMEGSTRAADLRILEMLRTADGRPVGPSWVPSAVRDITALGSWAVLSLITLGAAGYLALRGNWRSALLLILAMVSAVLLDAAFKEGFGRQRPPPAFRLVPVRSSSFPSGHSMLSMVLYLTLGALLARVAPRHRERLYIMACAVLLVAIIGLSRIYLGVHYPSDVVAGWSAGFAWALLWWVIAQLSRRRRS